jgi:iron complex outermembrane receptor protein
MPSSRTQRALIGALIGLSSIPARADMPVFSAVAAAPGLDGRRGAEGEAPPARLEGPAGAETGPKVFSEMLENVIVTTRKREETLQETPLAVTVLGESSLKRLGVRRIDEIGGSVPNLEYGRAVGFTSSRITIRGVGQADPISTADPGVGLYLDGVFLPRAQTGLFAVSDVDRVEVVRGPQGTLFGKNTIGGAINVITRAPGPDFGGSAELRIGNFDLFETRASLNVPLSERLALRLSGATATRDGFEKDRLGGTDGDDDKLLAGRAQLLWQPSENLEVLFSADSSRENRVLNQG